MAERTTQQTRNLLQVKEVAAMMGLSASYIYRMARNREIPHYKSGGGKMLYFKREDIEAWMTATYVPTMSELAEQAERNGLGM